MLGSLWAYIYNLMKARLTIRIIIITARITGNDGGQAGQVGQDLYNELWNV